MRDRFVFVYLKRRSHKEADARFGSVAYGRHRARVVLGEMVSEYACIVLAPATVALYTPLRLLHNYGFTPGKAVNHVELMLGVLLQLAAEFVVDLLCVHVEERGGIPVLDSWRRSGWATRRRVYLYSMFAAVVIAYYLMGVTFVFRMPPECQPFPCAQCVTDGSGGSHLSGKGSAEEIVRWCITHGFSNATNATTAS